MKRIFLIAALAAAAGLAWMIQSRSGAPETVFAKVTRETLVSTLPTNGKVEPFDWRPIRAESGGLIDRLNVQEGRSVSHGSVVAVLRSSDALSALAAAEAQIARARADLTAIERGGSGTELAEIQSSLDKAKLEKTSTEREIAVLARLVAKNAVTRADVEAQRQKLRGWDLQIEALERKRAALVSPTDRGVAEAKLKEAQAAAEAARRRISQAEIRAPMSGVIYNLATRAGAYLNPGDPIANVGRLDRLRVRVYVDEPELGRVTADQPVRITWDALPGVTWDGRVERLPAEIIAMGTRQVGEVIVIIENTNGRLVSGTNINAEIRTSMVPDALTIPTAAIRRENRDTGVYVLKGDRIAWQKVTRGATSATRSQITVGLSENDSVALPGERSLREGDTVKPVYQ